MHDREEELQKRDCFWEDTKYCGSSSSANPYACGLDTGIYW